MVVYSASCLDGLLQDAGVFTFFVFNAFRFLLLFFPSLPSHLVVSSCAWPDERHCNAAQVSAYEWGVFKSPVGQTYLA